MLRLFTLCEVMDALADHCVWLRNLLARINMGVESSLEANITCINYLLMKIDFCKLFTMPNITSFEQLILTCTREIASLISCFAAFLYRNRDIKAILLLVILLLFVKCF